MGLSNHLHRLLELDNRLNVVKAEILRCGATRSTHGRANMDTTTLLIIVLVVLLLGGGGWYGRGRWYGR